MSANERLPRLPYVLLGAMTAASFGGPFVILVTVRGGPSPRWPPDRTVEWAVIALIFMIVFGLFVACASIGWWHPGVLPARKRENGDIRSPGSLSTNKESMG
jgi:hypothetical protein